MGLFFWRCNIFFHFLFNGRANSTSSQLFAGSSSSAAKNRFLVLNFFLRLEETKKKLLKKISDRKFLHFDFRRRRKDFILGKTTLRVFFAIPAGDSIEYWRTLVHGVWKSQKKSHSTLRAKRATFTFWVDNRSLNSAKNGPIWRVFENLKLAVKQSHQTGQF